MSLIQFSAQYGGGNSRNVIGPYHMRLNEIFYNDERKNRYFYTLEYLSIIFRVSGSNRNFKSEGPERLKKVKNKAILTIDFSIPQEKWDGVDSNDFKAYVADGIRGGMNMLIEACERMGEIQDKERILHDFNDGIDEFLRN